MDRGMMVMVVAARAKGVVATAAEGKGVVAMAVEGMGSAEAVMAKGVEVSWAVAVLAAVVLGVAWGVVVPVEWGEHQVAGSLFRSTR
jgi:hypothetical protein